MTCAPVSAALAVAEGGTIGDAVKAGALAFAQPYIWGAVGDVLQGIGAAASQIGSAASAVVTGAAHGVVGGALAVAQGGSFIQGFAANAIGGATGILADGFAGHDVGMHTAMVAAAGCAVAVFSGGKCANGAVTAAFANLYNHFQHKGTGIDHVNPWDIGNDAHDTLQEDRVRLMKPDVFSERWSDGEGVYFAGPVDLGNVKTRELWEIKPANPGGFIGGHVQLLRYIGASRYNYGGTSIFNGGITLTKIGKWATYEYTLTTPGLITYTHRPHPGVQSTNFGAYFGKFYGYGPGSSVAPFLLPGGRGRGLARP